MEDKLKLLEDLERKAKATEDLDVPAIESPILLLLEQHKDRVCECSTNSDTQYFCKYKPEEKCPYEEAERESSYKLPPHTH